MLVSRKWYAIIFWWELARIPYNLIMIGIGLVSFYISYVTIPLVYEIIGLGLNLFFTLGWIIELKIGKGTKQERKKYRTYFFFGYLGLSVLLVFLFSVMLISLSVF